MRTLVILRGSPASGKSTFIQQNNLQDWTISADEIRLLFQSPVTKIDGGKEISQKNDNKVWDLIYTLMEERMKRGEFIIIDATHSRSQWINKYKELTSKYRYRVYAIEFIPTLETVLLQNKSRGDLKFVPEEYVLKSYEFVKTDPLPGWISKISKEEFLEMISGTIKPFDFSQYEKIHHIGDLHGCYQPFKEYFDSVGGLKDNEMWIFVGDYTDRGIQNGLLLQFLIDNFMGKKNVLFLEGNHECHARNWANGESLDNIKSKEFKYFTLPDIKNSNIDMGQIREFYRRIGQIAYYKYQDLYIYVNHAGCPILPTQLTTTDEYTHGIGKYEDILEIENTFNKLTSENCYQIHGHRNIGKMPIRNNRCFNITEEIEYGGFLRIVTLDTTNGFSEFLIKNNVFKENKKEIPVISENIAEEPSKIIESLLNSKDVDKKNLGDNIVSFNFSRDVFYDKKWNDITIKARGLFVNLNTGKIVARSWNKFFNIDETDDTKYTKLKRDMKFPAKVYLKENGFLCLVGYNEEKDELFIASKSTNTGEFVSYINEIFQSVNFNFKKAKEICKKENLSLIFEMIHPFKDAHIIEYSEMKPVLINVVYNEFEYKNVAYNAMKAISKELNVEIKQEVETFKNWDEFSDWYNTVLDNYQYKYDNQFVEGFVVECADGFMFKIKTEYYKFWKKMRGALEKLNKGRFYNTSWLQSPKEIDVFYFIKNMSRENLENKSIIDIRKEYLSIKGEAE